MEFYGFLIPFERTMNNKRMVYWQSLLSLAEEGIDSMEFWQWGEPFGQDWNLPKPLTGPHFWTPRVRGIWNRQELKSKSGNGQKWKNKSGNGQKWKNKSRNRQKLKNKSGNQQEKNKSGKWQKRKKIFGNRNKVNNKSWNRQKWKKIVVI